MPQLDKVTFAHQIVVVCFLFLSLFIVIGWLGISTTFAQMVSREFLGGDNLAEDREPLSKAKSFLLLKSTLFLAQGVFLNDILSEKSSAKVEIGVLIKNIDEECVQILKNSKSLIAASTLLN